MNIGLEVLYILGEEELVRLEDRLEGVGFQATPEPVGMRPAAETPGSLVAGGSSKAADLPLLIVQTAL